MTTATKPKAKKPLERHKLVLKKLSDNISKGMTLEKAMLASGYSKSYARSSTTLKNTESWDSLIEAALGNKFLLKKHTKLLEKRELFYNKDVGIVETGQVHSDVKGGLDMAYKLKSKYAPEEHNLKFKGFSKAQLIDSIMSKITKKKK